MVITISDAFKKNIEFNKHLTAAYISSSVEITHGVNGCIWFLNKKQQRSNKQKVPFSYLTFWDFNVASTH